MGEQIIPAHKRVNKSDFFWLAYLVFFLIEPIARHSSRYWLECLTIMLVFVALWVAYLKLGSVPARVAVLVSMYVLGAATLPMNAGATTFMIYAAAVLPFTVASVPWLVAGFATEAVLLAVEGSLLHSSPYNWLIGIVMILIVGGSNVFFAQNARADCKLRRKQEEIEALAAVAERERIARDLHDVLGHTLSVIVLKSELAGRLLEREREVPSATSATAAAALLRARTEIGDVEKTARTALAEVREAIGGYRARGLGAEIEAARGTLASAGVSLSTEGNLQPAGLSAAEETVLALALREAVTNIVRHAQATECRLRLVMSDGRHRLSIEDNGRHATLREGNGLRGMRERVESLGGQLSLTRESGTHLLIELPQRASA